MLAGSYLVLHRFSPLQDSDGDKSDYNLVVDEVSFSLHPRLQPGRETGSKAVTAARSCCRPCRSGLAAIGFTPEGRKQPAGPRAPRDDAS